MSAHSLQAQDDGYVRFVTEHPGVLSASVGTRWKEALDSGWTAESLVRHARNYRLLIENQDGEPLTAAQWLASMTDSGPEQGLPCESAAFAAAVRALRAGRGISQAELGRMAGISTPTISMIETDSSEHSVRWSTLADLAGAFEMSLGDMLTVGYTVLGR